MRARTSWHAHTPGRALTTILIGATLACTGFALTSPAAMPVAAATQGTVGQGIHVPIPGYGESWLGAFEVPTGADGAMSWCIQMWVAPGVGAPPLTVDAHDDPVLAWLIETYADPNDRLAQAAIAYTVHQRAEVPGVVANGDVERAKQLLADATPAEVRDLSAQMVATATAQAGPYADPTPTVDASDLRFGTITNLGVTGANGGWVPGLNGTVELMERDDAGTLIPTDRAVFDLNDNDKADPGETNTWTGTTPEGPLTLHYVATGIGDVVARARFDGLRTMKLAYYGMDGKKQDNLSLSPGLPGDPTERTGETEEFPVADGFRVTGVSQVEAKILDEGDQACDQLTLAATPDTTWLPVGGAPVTVPLVATLWQVGTQPVTPTETTPDTATVLAEIPVQATGPGTYRACADTDVDPAMLTWQWRTDSDAMPDDLRPLLLEEWQDTFGLAAETSSRRHTPEVVTSLSVRTTAGGLRLVDELWAEGYPDDHGEFTGGSGFGGDHPDEVTELWFFPEGTTPTDQDLESHGTLIGSVRRDPVNGYQSLSTPDLAWPQSDVDADADGVLDPLPGIVAARTQFSGDDRTRPFTTSVTDPTEQVTVLTPAPESVPLAVSTAIQPDAEVAPGADLHLQDATEVTGTVPEGGLLLTNELYRWTGETALCSPETLIASSDPITVTAAGQYLSTPVAITAEPGVFYGYAETVRTSEGRLVHRGECGASTETIRVPALPEVETTAHASSDSPTVGDELWDTIAWRGDIPTGSSTSAELFRVPEGQALTCTPDTLIWTSAELPIQDSRGSADTDRFRTTEPGTYGFVETTRGPDGTVLSTGECGDPAETLTVADAPPATPFGALATTGTALPALLATTLAALITGVVTLSVRHRHHRALPGRSGGVHLARRFA
ncbi:hypothetical protein [Cellulomonas sp. NPDC089187]|uniref:hypothetical protein n=1 Tax=Cellulomonas sp. NPDC089187 TaxID=3154970 RepID=UPI00341AE510